MYSMVILLVCFAVLAGMRRVYRGCLLLTFCIRYLCAHDFVYYFALLQVVREFVLFFGLEL